MIFEGLLTVFAEHELKHCNKKSVQFVYLKHLTMT